MKMKVLTILLIILAIFFISRRDSFSESVNLVVTQGDEASSPNPNNYSVSVSEPVVAQSSSTQVYATVQSVNLSEESGVGYRKKELGKQLNVQEIVRFTPPPNFVQAVTPVEEAPVNQKKRVISLAELQQELQEDKLILSKPVPFFLGGS